METASRSLRQRFAIGAAALFAAPPFAALRSAALLSAALLLPAPAAAAPVDCAVISLMVESQATAGRAAPSMRAEGCSPEIADIVKRLDALARADKASREAIASVGQSMQQALAWLDEGRRSRLETNVRRSLQDGAKGGDDGVLTAIVRLESQVGALSKALAAAGTSPLARARARVVLEGQAGNDLAELRLTKAAEALQSALGRIEAKVDRIADDAAAAARQTAPKTGAQIEAELARTGSTVTLLGQKGYLIGLQPPYSLMTLSPRFEVEIKDERPKAPWPGTEGTVLWVRPDVARPLVIEISAELNDGRRIGPVALQPDLDAGDAKAIAAIGKAGFESDRQMKCRDRGKGRWECSSTGRLYLALDNALSLLEELQVHAPGAAPGRIPAHRHRGELRKAVEQALASGAPHVTLTVVRRGGTPLLPIHLCRVIAGKKPVCE